MNRPSDPRPRGQPSVGVVIRFKDSAATLPAVLAGLGRQTRQPDRLLGINNQSADASPALLRAAGATVLDWTESYRHPRVLNFALRHCPTDLVLVLSSHTVLKSADAIERLVNALADPQTACASAKWDADPFYSDNVSWRELQTKGLKFGSVYSNSMGMLRRSLWKQSPFDESLASMEDAAWALEQLKRGHTARRLNFAFDYSRSGRARAFTFALLTFKLASRHGLRVTWLGPRRTMAAIAGALANRRLASDGPAGAAGDATVHWERLWAWLTWRWRPTPSAE